MSGCARRGRSAAVESLEIRRLLSVVGAKFTVAGTSAMEGAYDLSFDGTNFLVGIEKDHVIGAQLITPTGGVAAPVAASQK